MTKMQVDFEHSDRTWWQAGGQELWAGLCDEGSWVIVDDAIAASWLAEAGKLPGWDEGPDYAPHPIASSPISDEDALLE